MDMQKLLDDIGLIIESDKKDKELKKENGDLFNLFQVLSLNTNELIHSRMIAELLNPKGTHGKGSLFLNKFLSLFDLGIRLDPESTSVVTEFDTGAIPQNYASGGKIDILITDAYNHALIIENKIFAGDQKKQLLRYSNYAKAKKYEYQIIYLTLDGHEPSDFSTGKEPDFDYIMYSYEEDILTWLDECMKECVGGSALYCSIYQYSQCIRNILNLMNKKSENALLQIATDAKNVNSVLALFQNEQSIKRRIIDEFIEKLFAKAQEMGFNPWKEDGFGEKGYSCLSFLIPKQSKKWGLFIVCNKKNANDVCFFVNLCSGEKTCIKKSDLEYIPYLWKVFPQEKLKPCGGSFFWSESGAKYSGEWYDWYNNATLQAMVDGRLLDFIVKKIFTPVIQSKVFEILDRY